MHLRTGEALSAAAGLRDLILENRAATEKDRQLPDPVVASIRECRLGRMALPAEYSGLETPVAEALAAFETLAEAEASVAWIVWNSSLPCWFARFLSEEARGEIFSDPSYLYASSTRPSGKATLNGDSYKVGGRWSLVSGCVHAAWIPVMCMVEKDGEVEMLAPEMPHMRMFFVPQEKYEILDTWYVGGLRGTGSHDVVLRDVSVPVGHSCPMGGPSLMDSPLGRVPIFATVSAGCASICLGAANASLRALRDLASGKTPVDKGPSLRDRPAVQSLVARTDTRLKALRARLQSSCDRLWEGAQSGAERELADLAAVVGASITTGRECRTAVSDIYAAAGASALYTDNPIERAHRDVHAAAQHIALQPFWLEQAGRVHLGLEPNHPLFLL